MNSITLMNEGTGLSCAAEVVSARRPGIGLPVSAHQIRGTRALGQRWATTDITFRTQAINVAYPQVDVDVPTIEKFRVPSSIRERSS